MRFGRQYAGALPLLNQGFDSLTGVLQDILDKQRRSKDEKQIRDMLYRDETVAPVIGQTSIRVPGMSTGARTEERERQPVIGPMSPTVERVQPSSIAQRVLADVDGREMEVPIYGGPQKRTTFRGGLQGLTAENLSELLAMKSGAGRETVQNLQLIKALMQPVPIDKGRFEKLGQGEQLYDLLRGSMVANNPAKQTPTEFNLNRLPFDVQQAYRLANNLEAEMTDRRTAADYFYRKTGYPITVGAKAPDSSSSGWASRIRSVNGGLYYLTGKTDPNTGLPEVTPLIPPGLSPAAQVTALTKMLDEGVIDDATFSDAMLQIATTAKIPAVKPPPKTPGEKRPEKPPVPEGWDEAIRVLKKKGYTDEEAQQYLEKNATVGE